MAAGRKQQRRAARRHSRRGPALGLVLGLAALLAAGCGKETVNLDDDGGDGLVGGGPCSPDKAACNNCVDDDGDGMVDGDDPECTGPLDNREDSFATGIPGDNVDSKKQDCFFDGNSGSGDDGCEINTCCLLAGDCPADIDPNFDRATDCPAVSQSCIDTCFPLTPPGCDCFGCCTICDDSGCYEVLTNPAVAPDCDLAHISDPTACPTCVKNTDCGGGDCDPSQCVLCPGQTPDDLPPDCGGMNSCPGSEAPCTTSGDCGAGEYCSNGCCIGTVD